MTRWLLRGAVLAAALLGVLVLAANVTHAEPRWRSARAVIADGRDLSQNPTEQNTPWLAAANAGYTLQYSFSSDPKDITYVATFAPDVSQIYAWATVVQEGDAPEKQFTVDVQFLAPDGTTVQSKWYTGDNGTLTSYPADQDTFGPDNVTRRYVDIAGTPNAELTGQWTVNYTVGGKLIASGNFSLADATDIAQDDAAGGGEQVLADAGYNVIEFKEAEGKSGNIFAYTIMEPASQDLYSSETSQQIVDGLAALRKAFQDSETLYVFLRYDPRYEVAYFADAPDVDAYLTSNDFGAFSKTISVDVYDNEEGKYLGKTSKDFISKNFGAGTYSTPPSPPLSKNSNTVGSIRVSVAPSSLPADGTSKAIVSATVYDKRNKPVQDAEVTFEINGSGQGAIRPRVTSTDENGEADAVFTVGKVNGSVTITASSGGATGSGVLTIGSGSKEAPADNVIAVLSAQGYKATDVGYLGNDKKTVGVVVDLGPSFTVDELSGPIIYGMTALRLNYPDATTLAVIIPYQQNLLIFPATVSEYDALGAAITAAKTDTDKDTAFIAFLTKVFAKAAYVDRNGKQLSTFKDFYNKNFSGG